MCKLKYRATASDGTVWGSKAMYLEGFSVRIEAQGCELSCCLSLSDKGAIFIPSREPKFSILEPKRRNHMVTRDIAWQAFTYLRK